MIAAQSLRCSAASLRIGRRLARSLAQDADASVRAEAAWSLAPIGDAGAIPLLATMMKSGDVDVATNATAAIGRIARRVNAPTDSLCSALADGRATVRANALAGLRARCGDGHTERQLLAEDPSELVRASAARALTAVPLPDDHAAIDRCAATDRSAEVARLCRPHAPRTTKVTHAVTVFVVGEAERGHDAAIRPRAPFLLEYDDGALRRRHRGPAAAPPRSIRPPPKGRSHCVASRAAKPFEEDLGLSPTEALRFRGGTSPVIAPPASGRLPRFLLRLELELQPRPKPGDASEEAADSLARTETWRPRGPTLIRSTSTARPLRIRERFRALPNGAYSGYEYSAEHDHVASTAGHSAGSETSLRNDRGGGVGAFSRPNKEP